MQSAEAFPIGVFGVKDVIQQVRQAAAKAEYRDKAVLVTMKVLHEADLMASPVLDPGATKMINATIGRVCRPEVPGLLVGATSAALALVDWVAGEESRALGVCPQLHTGRQGQHRVRQLNQHSRLR